MCPEGYYGPGCYTACQCPSHNYLCHPVQRIRKTIVNHCKNIWLQVLGCVCQPRYSGSNCSTPLPIYGYSALDPVGGDGGDGALYAGNMLDSNKSCSHGEGPYWVNAR